MGSNPTAVNTIFFCPLSAGLFHQHQGLNWDSLACQPTWGCSSVVERPLRMREAPGSNPGISIAFLKGWLRQVPKVKRLWARPGFEPGTSRTRSANHTPRPTSHLFWHDPNRMCLFLDYKLHVGWFMLGLEFSLSSNKSSIV